MSPHKYRIETALRTLVKLDLSPKRRKKRKIFGQWRRRRTDEERGKYLERENIWPPGGKYLDKENICVLEVKKNGEGR